MQLQASIGSALLGCAALAGFFVGSLYFAPKTVRELSHNDDTQIKWRFGAAVLSCTASPIVLQAWECESCTGGIEADSLLSLIGVRTEGLLTACVIPLSMMIGLFAGSLLDMFFAHKQFGKPDLPWEEFLSDFFPNCPVSSLQRLRNMVVAPFAEELVFRSCMGALLSASGMGQTSIIFGAPLFFGVAHLHHFFGNIRHGTPARTAAIISLVQMTYTTLFGALEMFIFLRTGHLAAVFLCHSWCNLMGLPSVDFLRPTSPNYKHRWAILALHVAGVLFFVTTLNSAMNPELYGNKIFVH